MLDLNFPTAVSVTYPHFRCSISVDAAVRANVPKQVRDALVELKNEAMDPSKTSILANAVALDRLPGLLSFLRRSTLHVEAVIALLFFQLLNH